MNKNYSLQPSSIRLLSPHVTQPGKPSDEWQPVSVCRAQIMPLFLISAFLLTCVSGNRPRDLRSILIPRPAVAIDKNIALKISSFKNIFVSPF
jgi:hypothetical protein